MDFWYYQPLCDVLAFPQGLFVSEKMKSLEISDMYFVKFDVFGQYLNNIWSMFVQQVSVQVYMSPNYDQDLRFCAEAWIHPECLSWRHLSI